MARVRLIFSQSILPSRFTDVRIATRTALALPLVLPLAAEVVQLHRPSPAKQPTATGTTRFKAAIAATRSTASSVSPFSSSTSGTRPSVRVVPISGLAMRYASACLFDVDNSLARRTECGIGEKTEIGVRKTLVI
jgi:hypothetical protein